MDAAATSDLEKRLAIAEKWAKQGKRNGQIGLAVGAAAVVVATYAVVDSRRRALSADADRMMDTDHILRSLDRLEHFTKMPLDYAVDYRDWAV